MLPDPNESPGCLAAPSFILIGPIILIGGLSAAGNRKRLVRSIVGSLIVLLGNCLIFYNIVLGLAVVGLGVYLVFARNIKRRD